MDDRILTLSDWIEKIVAWIAGLIWMAPLAYIVIQAFIVDTPSGARFGIENIVRAWNGVPFARYYLNTALLACGVTLAQLAVGILAAYAFARFEFPFKRALFSFVLLQLMIVPEVLMTQNYQTIAGLGLFDTIAGIGLPYVASAFCIFYLRQSFMSIPDELIDAAKIEGVSRLGILWRVFIPISRPAITAYALVSISTQWNNFLWPLIISTNDSTRPISVGLERFLAPETGLNLPLMAAATVIVIGPLLAVFILGQRMFINSFIRSGIR